MPKVKALRNASSLLCAQLGLKGFVEGEEYDVTDEQAEQLGTNCEVMEAKKRGRPPKSKPEPAPAVETQEKKDDPSIG